MRLHSAVSLPPEDDPHTASEEKRPKKAPVISAAVSQIKYIGTVSQIGNKPRLCIDGIGDIRFSYRSVKKLPKMGKPYLQVGDVVECRLTLMTQQQKAVSVRLLRTQDGKPPPRASNHDQPAMLLVTEDSDEDTDEMPPLLSSVLTNEVGLADDGGEASSGRLEERPSMSGATTEELTQSLLDDMAPASAEDVPAFADVDDDDKPQLQT